MKILFNGLLAAVALSLNACTWVESTPEGEKVRVLSSAEVSGCKHVGKTTVSTAEKVGVVVRLPEKVQEELNTLARNSAPEIGGDTVVPVGEPQQGRQVYEVYRCMPQAQ